MRPLTFLLASTILGLAGGYAAAQNVIVYPAQGQSQEQLDKDRYECHRWSVQQTGVDPTQPQPAQASAPPPPANAAPPPTAGVVRGGVRGAAVGAIGGAIAGDAGKGAAIGATTGGAIGMIRRHDQQAAYNQSVANQQRQYDQAQAQRANAAAAQADAYVRALSACLQGRGYTVS